MMFFPQVIYILALPPSKDKIVNSSLKNQIKVHSCQVLLSFHINIIFPSYSGSVENKINSWSKAVLIPPLASPPDASSPLGGQGGEDGECWFAEPAVPLAMLLQRSMEALSPIPSFLLAPLLKSWDPKREIEPVQLLLDSASAQDSHSHLGTG